jgi:hypothetical protein
MSRKHIAVLLLVGALSAVWPLSMKAQQDGLAEYEKKSRENDKKQQKASKKALKKQIKLAKKTAKKQKKAMKKAQKAQSR